MGRSQHIMNRISAVYIYRASRRRGGYITIGLTREQAEALAPCLAFEGNTPDNVDEWLAMGGARVFGLYFTWPEAKKP